MTAPVEASCSGVPEPEAGSGARGGQLPTAVRFHLYLSVSPGKPELQHPEETSQVGEKRQGVWMKQTKILAEGVLISSEPSFPGLPVWRRLCWFITLGTGGDVFLTLS